MVIGQSPRGLVLGLLLQLTNYWQRASKLGGPGTGSRVRVTHPERPEPNRDRHRHIHNTVARQVARLKLRLICLCNLGGHVACGI